MLLSSRVTLAGECPSLFTSHGLVEDHRLLDGFIREYVGGARRSVYGTLEHDEPDLAGDEDAGHGIVPPSVVCGWILHRRRAAPA